MNSKGINPLTILGIILILAAAVTLFFAFGVNIQLPSFEQLSLRFILCGLLGAAPVFNIFDIATWLPALGFQFCLTSLPLLAGIILGVASAAWVLSTFPKSVAVPIIPILALIVGFVAGFLLSGLFLDFWWIILIVAIIVTLIKLKFFGGT